MGCNTSKASTNAVVENKPVEFTATKPTTTQPPPPPPPAPVSSNTLNDQSKNPQESVQPLSINSAVNEPVVDGKYDLEHYLALPKINTLIVDKVATEEKLSELFSLLDDDKDGFLTNAEVDDVVYLVQTSHAEKVAEEAQPKVQDDGPILSEENKQSIPPPPPSRRPMESSDAVTPGGTRIGGPAGRRPPTKFMTPEASPRPLTHVTPGGDMLSPKSNIMSDFDDDLPIQTINSPGHPNDVSALSVSFNGSDAEDTAAKNAKNRRSYVDERDFIGPTPPIKKGFLMTSPMKENLYHVLDSGVLFCMDSNARSPKSFSLDSKGINLRGRKLVVREDKVLELLPPTRPEGSTASEFDDEDGTYRTIEIKPRNDRERQAWITAFEDHIEFLQRQDDYHNLRA